MSSSRARRWCCSRYRAPSHRRVMPSACMAVNDVFVMNAWGKAQGVGDKVLMLADGNGTYAKALGLELDGSKFGMGTRGQRFAITVRDGVATQVAVEEPGQFKVSAAEAILAKL